MAWLVSLLLLVPAQGTESDVEQLKDRVAELERKLEAQEVEKDAPKLQEPVRDPAQEVPTVSDLYSKPFAARFGGAVSIGGYIDLEYVYTEGSNRDTFDAHRFVPFIYADVTENIKVMAEMEIEHGTGVSLEFAHLDYLIADSINFRGGIILDPLGNFNLVHDAPYQDLAIRPLVDRFVIPAVLREPGIGFFGTFDVDPWVIDYEIYLVNGFKALDVNGATSVSLDEGLRDARPHTSALGSSSYRDINDEPAGVGRLSISPFLGLEVGGSFYAGDYDERGDNLLTIWAVDWTVDLGGVANVLGADPEFWSRFEVVGEYAAANLRTDGFAAASLPADEMDGMYVEGRFHFMPAFLRECIPGANEESTFTLVYRYGMVDIDGAEQDENAFGVNFRLRENTVFKFEYILREEGGLLPDADFDQIVASLATYF